MVATKAQFTILATFCSLMVLSVPASVDGAVIPHTTREVSHKDAEKSDKPPREQTPLLPLPVAAQAKSNANSAGHKHKGKHAGKPEKAKSHRSSRETETGSPLSGHLKQAHFALPMGRIAKRSIIIAGPHSASYTVSRRTYEETYQKSFQVRQHPDGDGVPGVVHIMSAVAGSPDGTKIAALFLEPDSGDAESKTFVLNASATNETQFNMIAATQSAPTSISAQIGDMQVILQLPVFNESSATMVPYCATYDPNPPEAKPLTVDPCMQNIQEHKSQRFNYNSNTGVITPMWFQGEQDGKTDTQSSDPATPNAAGIASITDVDSNNSTAEGGTDEGATTPTDPFTNNTIAARDAPATSSPQNVTLQFIPSAPAVPAQAKENAVEESSTTSFQTVTMTATMTETTTMTQTIGAQDVSTAKAAATPSPSVMTEDASIASSASVEGSTDTNPQATTSSTAGATETSDVTSTSTATAAALGVQVVGAESPPSARTTTTDATAQTTSTPAAGATSSPCPDAEAVASEIIASDGTATASGTASATGVVDADIATSVTGTVSSAESSMTPVSTAPYQWMFKAEERL